ncbi:cysteine peptidase family C39 domain-containing protein [Paramaledivibacter caminithermalis]|uniref:Peptidase C39-like domain-containing protein n=1 Tax=Paramaledivibacter caminithermalis (strain DSM 15212 / CIP 107654 / DViRD3) TaxID=1121301 RepID=A0A1M6R212_PARC5|nr:hypothetical protein [Paramaledivibacter caminithermalis]SHK26436.1 hypothetical protein SAMN02745912_02807 [Paramaledivibacter caminithermalis DSM 15212]
MKKFLALFLTIIMLLSMSLVAFGETHKNDYDIEQKYAELFVKKLGRTVEVHSPILLYNVKGNEEAICFSLGEKGYLIINKNDLSIPELSFEGKKPFIHLEKRYVYNGPLAYYELKGGKFFSLKAKKIINGNFKKIYDKNKIDKHSKLSEFENEIYTLNYSTRGVANEEYLSKSLKTWYKSGGYCGPIAAAITMMFYDEVVSEKYVDTDNENENDLIDIMAYYIDPDHSTNPGSSPNELRDGITSYLGGQNVNNYATKSTYNFNTIKSKINSNRPQIIGTANDPTYYDHWMTVHGYYDDGMDEYVIVNNGWGDNNVWLSSDRGTFDYLIYLWNN